MCVVFLCNFFKNNKFVYPRKKKILNLVNIIFVLVECFFSSSSLMFTHTNKRVLMVKIKFFVCLSVFISFQFFLRLFISFFLLFGYINLFNAMEIWNNVCFFFCNEWNDIVDYFVFIKYSNFVLVVNVIMINWYSSLSIVRFGKATLSVVGCSIG